MVTHGHGQGYADINFVIPETVERYQLWKGPYFPQFGDFDNAGALNLVLKDEFEENFVLAEGGSFDQQRYVFGASPRLWSVKTLFAGQAFFTLSKYNGLAKLTAEPTVDSRLSFSGSVYQGDWDGSGQVPLREVSAGRLDRFGSIDPTEGGRTDREPRSPLPLHADAPRRVGVPGLGRPWCAPGRRSARERSSEPLRAPLWSDFTFFKDAGLRFVLGPQGQTIDTGDALPIPGAHYVPPATASSRTTRAGSYGARGSCTRTFELFGRPMQGQVALETRNDHIDVALYRQVERNRYFTINKVKVDERSFSGYLSHQTFFLDWIRLEVGPAATSSPSTRRTACRARTSTRRPTRTSPPYASTAPPRTGP